MAPNPALTNSKACWELGVYVFGSSKGCWELEFIDFYKFLIYYFEESEMLAVVVWLPWEQQSMLGVGVLASGVQWGLSPTPKIPSSLGTGTGGDPVGAPPNPRGFPAAPRPKISIFNPFFSFPSHPIPSFYPPTAAPGAFWEWGFTPLPLNPQKSFLNLQNPPQNPKILLKNPKILLKTPKLCPHPLPPRAAALRLLRDHFGSIFWLFWGSGVHPLPFKPPKSS